MYCSWHKNTLDLHPPPPTTPHLFLTFFSWKTVRNAANLVSATSFSPTNQNQERGGTKTFQLVSAHAYVNAGAPIPNAKESASSVVLAKLPYSERDFLERIASASAKEQNNQ